MLISKLHFNDGTQNLKKKEMDRHLRGYFTLKIKKKNGFSLFKSYFKELLFLHNLIYNLPHMCENYNTYIWPP